MSLRTLGSLTLCRSLLHAGLVDRIYDRYPDVALDLLPAAASTGGCSCSSTSPRRWPGRPYQSELEHTGQKTADRDA